MESEKQLYTQLRRTRNQSCHFSHACFHRCTVVPGILLRKKIGGQLAVLLFPLPTRCVHLQLGYLTNLHQACNSACFVELFTQGPHIYLWRTGTWKKPDSCTLNLTGCFCFNFKRVRTHSLLRSLDAKLVRLGCDMFFCHLSTCLIASRKENYLLRLFTPCGPLRAGPCFTHCLTPR